MVVVKENVKIKGSELVSALIAGGLLPKEYEGGMATKVDMRCLSLSGDHNYYFTIEKEINISDIKFNDDKLVIEGSDDNEVLKADVDGNVTVNGGNFSKDNSNNFKFDDNKDDLSNLSDLLIYLKDSVEELKEKRVSKGITLFGNIDFTKATQKEDK